MWLIFAIGCHLGVPPSSVPALAVGDVRAPTAELAVGDDLRGALTGALARRGALGGDGAPTIGVEVVEATTSASAVGGGSSQVHTARLRVRFLVAGPYPRELELVGERAFSIDTVGQASTLVAAQARAEAFASLADTLCDDAAVWLLHGSAAGVPAP